jgi:hypothetical protein
MINFDPHGFTPPSFHADCQSGVGSAVVRKRVRSPMAAHIVEFLRGAVPLQLIEAL